MSVAASDSACPPPLICPMTGPAQLTSAATAHDHERTPPDKRDCIPLGSVMDSGSIRDDRAGACDGLPNSRGVRYHLDVTTKPGERRGPAFFVESTGCRLCPRVRVAWVVGCWCVCVAAKDRCCRFVCFLVVCFS